MRTDGAIAFAGWGANSAILLRCRANEKSNAFSLGVGIGTAKKQVCRFFVVRDFTRAVKVTKARRLHPQK
jgi:hypothetical protein